MLVSQTILSEDFVNTILECQNTPKEDVLLSWCMKKCANPANQLVKERNILNQVPVVSSSMIYSPVAQSVEQLAVNRQLPRETAVETAG